MLAFLKKEQPDILAVQEVYEDTIASLAQELGLPYTDYAPALIRETLNITEGNGVLSRFPIKKSEITFFDKPFGPAKDQKTPQDDVSDTPRNLEHTVLDVDGRDLHIFNTQGIWGFNGKDNPRRLAMIQSIQEAMKGSAPALLCGDFNVEEGTECISRLQNWLIDPFKGERKSSFNMRIKSGGGFGTSVVDFIFATQDLRIVKHESPDIDASDHLPLILEIEI